MTGVQVLIADDHAIVREGLRNLLESIDGFTVVGEADSGRAAIDAAVRLRPDLVVMDLGMPEVNGIVATQRIGDLAPDTRVIVLTMFDDDESLFEALKAGAQGYVLKGAARDDLVRAFVSCARGEAVFGPEVARRVLRQFEQFPSATSPFPELTDRERSVLDLIARGTANAAIAAQLGISTKTVRNHASNIFAKLHVGSRAEAMVKARDHGLGGGR